MARPSRLTATSPRTSSIGAPQERSNGAHASSINALPRELLTEIFSYTPIAARLLVLCLVCKRWRSAARSACQALIRVSDLGQAGGVQLASLPALTSLSIQGRISHFTLPTTLRTLKLSFPCIFDSFHAAEQNKATFLSQRFPHLTELDIFLPKIDPDNEDHTTRLIAFLNAHSASLESLMLFTDPSLSRPLAAQIQWPVLRILKTRMKSLFPLLTPVTPVLPALTDLQLVMANPCELDALPAQYHSCLTSLQIPPIFYLREGLQPLARLTRFTRLREVSLPTQPSPEVLQLFAPQLISRLAITDLAWEWLGQFRALHDLVLTSLLPKPTPVPLPHLRQVSIGGQGNYLPAGKAMRLAMRLMELYPRLARILLYVDFTDVGNSALPDLDMLVAMAASRSGPSLEIWYKPQTQGLLPLPACVRSGWVCVWLRTRKEPQPQM